MNDRKVQPLIATKDVFLQTAVEAALVAAEIQRSSAGKHLEVVTKSSDIDLVTQVDQDCEAAIRKVIGAAHPDHSVFGEEQGQGRGDDAYRWIVDPLDGTLNYAHGLPVYSVSIALEVDGGLEVGVVLNSVSGELFTATRGGGAFLDGIPIRVSEQADLRKCMVATGFAYVDEGIRENLRLFSRVTPRVRGVRRAGSAALDLAHVACGRLDAFWELLLNPWDVAAGILLIREAGGTVTDGTGVPYRLGQELIVATNGQAHVALLALLGT